MSSVAANYKFAKSHEWVKDNGDGTATVGVSEHAQGLLGGRGFSLNCLKSVKIRPLAKGFSLVESVKAAPLMFMHLYQANCWK